jgi:hypothetical protein
MMREQLQPTGAGETPFSHGVREAMTATSLPAGGSAERVFRVGHVVNRAWSVYGRNFFSFTAVTLIAALSRLLIQPSVNLGNPFPRPALPAIWFLLLIVLYPLSQAIVLHATFQVMSGRPRRLGESVTVGFRRFFPILGVGFIATMVLILYIGGAVLATAGVYRWLNSPGLAALGFLVSLIPAAILYLMWLLAIPACVIERLGPFRSLGRSRVLTKGHRWKLFGLALAVLIPVAIIGAVIAGVAIAVGTGAAFGLPATITRTLPQTLGLVWTAIWTAFYAVLGGVAYHDLRIAKEGIGTDQIAAVFE